MGDPISLQQNERTSWISWEITADWHDVNAWVKGLICSCETTMLHVFKLNSVCGTWTYYEGIIVLTVGFCDGKSLQMDI